MSLTRITECQTARAFLYEWHLLPSYFFFILWIEEIAIGWQRGIPGWLFSSLPWLSVAPPPPHQLYRKWPSVLASRLFGLAPRRVTWPPPPLLPHCDLGFLKTAEAAGDLLRFFLCVSPGASPPFSILEREANRAKILYSKTISKFLPVFYRDRRLILRSYRPYNKGICVAVCEIPGFFKDGNKKSTKCTLCRICFPILKGWLCKYAIQCCVQSTSVPSIDSNSTLAPPLPLPTSISWYTAIVIIFVSFLDDSHWHWDCIFTCKGLKSRFQEIDSASLCNLAGQYDNTTTLFLFGPKPPYIVQKFQHWSLS